MYGTVARIRVKPGKLEALKKLVQAELEAGIAGYCGQTFFQMDKDPTEVYMAVLFDLRESYFLNADDPKQEARYKEFVKLLEGEPEWHDGEVVFSDIK